MTDKIFPRWVNDRLPTEEDGDESQFSYVLCLNSDNTVYCCVYVDVNIGETWCRIPDEWNAGWPTNWTELIASPQECIDREKAMKKGMDFMMSDFGEEGAKKMDKIKDLEQALAKSDERVQYFENLFKLEADERIVIEGYLDDVRIENDLLKKLLKLLL